MIFLIQATWILLSCYSRTERICKLQTIMELRHQDGLQPKVICKPTSEQWILLTNIHFNPPDQDKVAELLFSYPEIDDDDSTIDESTYLENADEHETTTNIYDEDDIRIKSLPSLGQAFFIAPYIIQEFYRFFFFNSFAFSFR